MATLEVRHKARREQTGFTLIEVMVVVVILGILAAIVVPQIMDRPDEARIVKARNDVKALEAALDLYRLDNYQYPTTDQGIDALVTKPSGSPEPPRWKEGGYLKKMPVDPWGNPYQYLNPGTRAAVDIYSLGPDMTPSDDDIGNWNID